MVELEKALQNNFFFSETPNERPQTKFNCEVKKINLSLIKGFLDTTDL